MVDLCQPAVGVMKQNSQKAIENNKTLSHLPIFGNVSPNPPWDINAAEHVSNCEAFLLSSGV